ncbi:MAG: hypothetical protein EOO22_02995 [Comamonadaceae bacterium]|nr:MAG: hypothetical protein EOO22_02995 [Comamonadaceae bacterium]
MHSAPSVTYPVRPSRAAFLAWVAVWFAAWGVLALWLLAADPAPRRVLAAAAALAVPALAAWISHRGSERALTLVWDGQRWFLSEAPHAIANLSVHVDLQSAMLVRVASGRHARWIWLRAADAPPCWLDLRRAVHARPGRAGAAGPVRSASEHAARVEATP